MRDPIASPHLPVSRNRAGRTMSAASIHVAPRSRLDHMLEHSGARRLVTMASTNIEAASSPRIGADNHLALVMNDIAAPREGLILPARDHVERLLSFARESRSPLAISCYAGVSRSTAAAYVVACAMAPHVGEADLARRLRALSPSATPNPLIVALGDEILRRQGRMIEAVRAIGRGRDAFEGETFCLVPDP